MPSFKEITDKKSRIQQQKINTEDPARRSEPIVINGSSLNP